MELSIRQIFGIDAVEVFSWERVGKFCNAYGLYQGLAMDINIGCDFDKAADRKRCWEAVRRQAYN